MLTLWLFSWKSFEHLAPNLAIFGHITHKISNEPVKTADIQPSIRSTTRKVLTVTENVCEKRAIARVQHGQHPLATQVHT